MKLPTNSGVHGGDEGAAPYVFFRVDDLDAAVAAVERLGGTVDAIPGAEPSETFSARVWDGMQRIVAAHPDERVVVVSHGGVIGQILADATGSRPFAFGGADNGSISHVVIHDGRIVLRRFNDTTHLEPHFSVAAPPPI